MNNIRKTALIFMILGLMLVLVSCDQVSLCEEYIDEITPFDLEEYGEVSYSKTEYDTYASYTYHISSFDTNLSALNSFSEAYDYYNSLSDEQKQSVKNADVLTSQIETFHEIESRYNTLRSLCSLIEYCHQSCVDDLKNSLKDPDSYIEKDVRCNYGVPPYSDGAVIRITFRVTYSATNSYGGRLQDDYQKDYYYKYNKENNSFDYYKEFSHKP